MDDQLNYWQYAHKVGLIDDYVVMNSEDKIILYLLSQGKLQGLFDLTESCKKEGCKQCSDV